MRAVPTAILPKRRGRAKCRRIALRSGTQAQVVKAMERSGP